MWARNRSLRKVLGGQGGNRTPTAEGGWSTASGAHHLLNLPTVAAAPGRDLRSRGEPATGSFRSGADDGTRTRNLLFTKQLLYQLSYVGATRRDIPQLTPLAPGNDRAARVDGSSAGGARRSWLAGFRGGRGFRDGWSAREEVVIGRGFGLGVGRGLSGGRLLAGLPGARRWRRRRRGFVVGAVGAVGRELFFGGVGGRAASCGGFLALAGGGASSSVAARSLGASASGGSTTGASDQCPDARGGPGSAVSRWATASNSSTDPATAALSEPIAPRMGMRMKVSQRFRMAGPRP